MPNNQKTTTLETNNSHPTNACTSHFRLCSFLSTTSVSVFSLSMCHPSLNNHSGGFHSRLRKNIRTLGVRGLRHSTVTTAQSMEGAASSAYNYIHWDFINNKKPSSAQTSSCGQYPSFHKMDSKKTKQQNLCLPAIAQPGRPKLTNRHSLTLKIKMFLFE